MRRLRTLVALSMIWAGCDGPSSPPDSSFDAPPIDCTELADGTSCGAGRAICLDGECVRSECGDGFVDTANGEDCEDGNDIAFDGCEPSTCRFTCRSGADCDDGFECNGAEVCGESSHICEDAPDLLDATPCTLASGGGVCREGTCVEAGCGNRVIEPGEHCDDGNTIDGDGCETDCRWSCEVDPSVPNVWYLDCDGDGFSALDAEPRMQCLPPPADPCGGGWTLLLPASGYADCDDASASIHPGAVESCDGVDQNCDGDVDDGDNACGGVCALANAVGTPCDGPDTDRCQDDTYVCDGLNDTVCASGSDTLEVCGGDDEDCDGVIDEGFAGMADCDPAIPGCDTNTMSSPSNCGACGNVCGTANTTSATCAGGDCQFACVPPYQHCSSDDSTGCETNLGNDPENCGSCGHSCLGGSCVSGVCSPILLAGSPSAYTGLKSLYGLAVSGGYLFGTNWFQTAGQVFRIPVGGRPDRSVEWLVRVTPATGCPASPMVSDGAGHIFYGVTWNVANCPGQGIWEINEDGTGNHLVISRQNTAQVAADANYIYFTDQWGPGLFRWSRATGATNTFFPSDTFVSVFAEAGSVYFSNSTTNRIYAASPAISDARELATTSSPLLQTDSAYAYYFNSGDFYRVNKFGSPSPQNITASISSIASVQLFLVDSTYVYFISPRGDANTDNGQRISAFRKDGTSTSLLTLATIAPDNAWAFTQDATALYWTTYGRDGGTSPSPPPYSAIYRLAKPAP